MPQRLEKLETVDSADFFQRWIHRAIGCHDHDERQRGQAESFYPTHSHNRRDVEWTLRQAEGIDEDPVDDTDAWMKQEYPTHCREEGRNQRAHSHEREHQFFPREIGSLYEPRDGNREK